MSQADNSIKNWRNLPLSNPKPDLQIINAYTKFPENPLIFTQVIILKRKTEGQTDIRRTYDWQMDGWMDRHTDVQREAIIPRDYRVVEYKNKKNIDIIWMKKKKKAPYQELWLKTWAQLFKASLS